MPTADHEDQRPTTYFGGSGQQRATEHRGAPRRSGPDDAAPRRPAQSSQSAPRSTGPNAADPLKVAVVYYSATGSVHALAQAVAQGARDAGGSVRVVRVRETAPPEAVESNPLWDAHVRATRDVPIATIADIKAADVILLGTPTRFGHVTSQLQTFIDTWGPLWGDGALQDKVFAAFTSSATGHGGQETTLMSIYTMVCHLGGIIVPPGYTDPAQFVTGNPYGASHTSENGQRQPDDDDLASAWVTGNRAASVADRLRRGTR